ncbi:hypothetical protein TrVGV298_003906 [Trichoderma virens]|nr:hypothetical protein TrVGV298_003906 [Trichoderma virens]
MSSNELERRQKSHVPDVVSNQFSSSPSSCSGLPKISLALRTHRTLNTAPSVYFSESSTPAPEGVPGDPPGADSVGLLGRANSYLSSETSIGLILGNKEDKTRRMEGLETLEVPMELAETVINMHTLYAAEMNTLKDTLKKEMRLLKQQNDELERRLDMQYGILWQTKEFMQNIRNGSFGGVDGGDLPTLFEERDDDDDDDVRMRSVDMEVPPTPDTDREPIRSTGRKVTKRKPTIGNSGVRKAKKRQTTARRALVEDKTLRSKNSADAMDLQQQEGLGSETLQEEEVNQEREDDGGRADDEKEDEDEDGLKILAGARRLRAVVRKSLWTAINDPPRDDNPRISTTPPRTTTTQTRITALPRRPQRRNFRLKTNMQMSLKMNLSLNPNLNLNLDLPLNLVAALCQANPDTASAAVQSPRYHTLPDGGRFHFRRMSKGTTVLSIWNQYKFGDRENPPIELLETTYGTEWRKRTTPENDRHYKYISNYINVRLKIIRYLERIIEVKKIEPEDACKSLGKIADGHIHGFLDSLTQGKDPFDVLPVASTSYT